MDDEFEYTEADLERDRQIARRSSGSLLLAMSVLPVVIFLLGVLAFVIFLMGVPA
jgi:hypothetical protein